MLLSIAYQSYSLVLMTILGDTNCDVKVVCSLQSDEGYVCLGILHREGFDQVSCRFPKPLIISVFKDLIVTEDPW